jgi:lysophospholipase L1-like esterase
MRSRLAPLCVIFAACTASGPLELPPPSLSAAPTALPPVSPTPGPSTAAPTPTASPSVAVAPVTAHTGPLAHFYDALRALEKKQRMEHVRITWLGDSHAQADFWPNAIRRGLQKRFGNGGLGFVHFGMKSYRHAGIKLDIKGGWRMRPKMPSTVDPWGDGAFGLGGILHAGFSGYRAVTLNITDERLDGRKLTLDLCYKPGLAEDEFELELTGAANEKIAPGKDAIGKIQHTSKTAMGQATLRARIKNGRPDFCGLVIETVASDGAGVVLDNLGINGARYATPLAWNEAAWATEVKRRPPELFIFEYGGNEASDGIIKPAEYKKQALALIARARRAVPAASCLVVGPSDRADAEQRIPPIVQVLQEAAAESKCQFWKNYEVMGGKGSLRKWRDDDRAAPEGIHLRPNGYAEVGALMLQDLMAGYQP